MQEPAIRKDPQKGVRRSKKTWSGVEFAAITQLHPSCKENY